MPSNKNPLKQHITCLSRHTELNLSPAEWLSALRQATEIPVLVIKDDSSKHTLMTHLSPWGAVCIHDHHWGIKKSALSVFRRLRGQNVWRHCLALKEQNISITEPLLYLEIKKGPFITHTYFVTRWIQGENLGKTAWERDRNSEKQLLDLLKKAASSAAGFHTRGFVHGDLKWSNFLWVDDPNTHVYLCDLDHVEKSGSARKQGRDLARFILAALEFDMDREIADTLINWYCDHRRDKPAGFITFLHTHMEKKKNRYKSRGSRLIPEE